LGESFARLQLRDRIGEPSYGTPKRGTLLAIPLGYIFKVHTLGRSPLRESASTNRFTPLWRPIVGNLAGHQLGDTPWVT
jgi:hypothetical protein